MFKVYDAASSRYRAFDSYDAAWIFAANAGVAIGLIDGEIYFGFMV